LISDATVTGFGILGHAQNLCDNQLEEVGIELHTLPFIKNTLTVNDEVFNFRLRIGYSAETSGGLMICMPREKAEGYIQELKLLDGCDAWIIGDVLADPDRKARIAKDMKVLEI
jgi:selenide,water dikinase